MVIRGVVVVVAMMVADEVEVVTVVVIWVVDEVGVVIVVAMTIVDEAEVEAGVMGKDSGAGEVEDGVGGLQSRFIRQSSVLKFSLLQLTSSLLAARMNPYLFLAQQSQTPKTCSSKIFRQVGVWARFD